MRQICSRCILPDNIPNISFDRNGVCNFCRTYSIEKGREKQVTSSLTEKKMVSLLKSNHKKSTYDCMCLYSGGKDSTYMLFQLVKKHKLRVLAVTLDNHFLAPETHDNIKRITKLINVDHVFCRPDFNVVKELVTASINESNRIARAKELSFMVGFVCWPCFTMIGLYALKTAFEKNVHNVAIGTTPGQLRQKKYNLLSKYSGALDSYYSMSRPMLKLLRRIGYKNGERIFSLTLKEKMQALKTRLVPFYDYIPYQEEKAIRLIEKELGWRRPINTDSCSTNCELNALGILLHIERFNIHPYVIPFAHDVREGVLGRDEALRAIKKLPSFENAKVIADKLGVKICK